MKAVLRCDASSAVGAGHVVRSLAIADFLAGQGWQCWFVTTEQHVEIYTGLSSSDHHVVTLPPDALFNPDALAAAAGDSADLLILDHYQLGIEYETACRDWADRVAVIDDLADRRHDCDVLVDQAPGRTTKDYRHLVPDHCCLLLGSGFALLREEFGLHRPAALERRETAAVQRVLVAFGGTDTKQMTSLALLALSKLDGSYEVVVVAGREAVAVQAGKQLEQLGLSGAVHYGASNVAELMRDSDIAVGAAGVSSLERCALALPTVAVVTAENQRRLATSLAATGALFLAGDAETVEEQDLGRAIEELATSPSRYQRMVRAAAAQCDGSGISRVAAVLQESQILAGQTTFTKGAG